MVSLGIFPRLVLIFHGTGSQKLSFPLPRVPVAHDPETVNSTGQGPVCPAHL